MRVYKEPSELSQHQRMRGDFKLLWPMVKDALHKGHWLFDKRTRQWYTPEEFLNELQHKEMNNYEVELLMQTVVIRDPKEGNAAYHKAIEMKSKQYKAEITELQQKGESFLEKVISYYQEKLKQR